jgi:hypothetical protein
MDRSNGEKCSKKMTKGNTHEWQYTKSTSVSPRVNGGEDMERRFLGRKLKEEPPSPVDCSAK